MKVVDVVVACGLAGVMAAVAIPSVHAARDNYAPRLAARFVAARLLNARVEALRRNAAVAVRFDPGDLGRMALYVDGDADGVRQVDIDAGVDQRLGAELRLADYFGTIALQVREGVPSPDGGGTLAAGDDPLRIGVANMVSFGPLGTATPGTIYLAGAAGPQVAVRVFGATATVRVLWFDRVASAWRDD
jgi:hypothetical protein